MDNNVVELEPRRQNRDADNSGQDRNVLESMWRGLQLSRWGSLANLASEVANQQPLQYLQMLSKYIEPLE